MHGDLGVGGIHGARQQVGAEVLVVEVLADEDHLRQARLVRSPRLIGGAELDLVVHALEDELQVALVREGQHSLGPEDVRGLGLEQLGHERVELGHIQETVDGEADRGDQREVVGLLLFLLLLLLVVVVMVLVLSVVVVVMVFVLAVVVMVVLVFVVVVAVVVL